ncbi:MAG: hypothetical protein WC881_09485, partial [Elusimicrobiota bacterium]
MKLRDLALIAAFCLAAAAPARPAPVSWDGGGGGSSWYDPFNWSPDGIPGVGDDVTIDMSTQVNIPGGLSAVNIRSLTLGDVSGQFSPVLLVSTAMRANGAGTVSALYGSATLLLNTSYQLSFNSLVMASGSSITHAEAAASGPPPVGSGPMLNLRVVDFLEVQAGASITARGKGYAPVSGTAPGASSANGGGGGGHGGGGGAGAFGGAGGGAYGLLVTPRDYGSGGGNGDITLPGGAGGGIIVIDAGSATINGLVTADGMPGSSGNSGGGAGAAGSIRIRTGYLFGQGSVSAVGGSGGAGAFSGGGGGGGGRVAVVVTGPYEALTSTMTFLVSGGAGGSAPNSGAAGGIGTVYMEPVHWTGNAAPGVLNASNLANWYGTASPVAGNTVVFGSSNPVKDCTWDMPLNVVVGSMSIRPGYTGTLTINNSLVVSGPWDMYAGTVAMTNDYYLSIGSNVTQTGGRFDLQNGSLTLQGGAYQRAVFTDDSALFHLSAAGAGTLDLASSLDINGNLSLGPNCDLLLAAGRTLRLAGQLSAVGAASLTAAPSHQTVADGAQAQNWQAPSGAWGRMRVSNTGPGVTWSTGSASLWNIGTAGSASELLVDTGSVFNLTGMRLNL